MLEWVLPAAMGIESLQLILGSLVCLPVLCVILLA